MYLTFVCRVMCHGCLSGSVVVFFFFFLFCFLKQAAGLDTGLSMKSQRPDSPDLSVDAFVFSDLICLFVCLFFERKWTINDAFVLCFVSLLRLCRSCSRDPTETILSRLKTLGQTFKEHYTKSTQDTTGSHIGRPVQSSTTTSSHFLSTLNIFSITVLFYFSANLTYLK